MPRVPNRGEFLKPFEGDKLAAGGEEVAVPRYIEAWPKLASTERLDCVSFLVGRVLATDSMPAISHVHFLATTVSNYVRNSGVTPADLAQIPREELAHRARCNVA